jgi:threonine dehydratase
MIPYIWLTEATQRISPYIQRTPLTWDMENDLYLKWENHQITGSFKLRGALNKVLTLQPWERDQGIVTASAGNHGQGVAYASRLVGAPVLIFASEHAVPAKVDAMRSLGAEVRLVPGGYAEAEAAGLFYGKTHATTWISPYNDGQVIAGQGTLGLETLEQLSGSQPSTWVVPVGGGGLVSGIAAALENLSPRPRLIGVQSTASAFFHALFHLGSQAGVIELPSLADGLSGPVEQGSVTIPMVRQRLDDMILVTEEQITVAIRFTWQRYHECIEGSAAVTLAAVLAGKITTKASLCIFSGGNIQPELHRTLCQQD